MRSALSLAGILASLVLLNGVLPATLNPYLFRIVMLCGINVILAVSLNLINGFAGQFSIGHAGFMAVGGYAAAMLSLSVGSGWVDSLGAAGVPAFLAQGAALFAAVLLGGSLAAIAGYVVGLPSLRLRGDYLAIVTLGFGEIIRVVLTNVEAVGGARGLPGIPGWTNFLAVGLVAWAVVGLSHNLASSSHGRALFAIRDDEVAASAVGIDVAAYKVMAFMIGAFFAGAAGGLQAHYDSYLNPNSFTFIRSIEIMVMVVLGGTGSVSGAVVAAVVLTVLPEVLRPVKDYRMVVYALLLIVLMIVRPEGLFGSRELSLRRLARR
jgi:branched-chain amino acid transport system permease protein